MASDYLFVKDLQNYSTNYSQTGTGVSSTTETGDSTGYDYTNVFNSNDYLTDFNNSDISALLSNGTNNSSSANFDVLDGLSVDDFMITDYSKYNLSGYGTNTSGTENTDGTESTTGTDGTSSTEGSDTETTKTNTDGSSDYNIEAAGTSLRSLVQAYYGYTDSTQINAAMAKVKEYNNSKAASDDSYAKIVDTNSLPVGKISLPSIDEMNETVGVGTIEKDSKYDTMTINSTNNDLYQIVKDKYSYADDATISKAMNLIKQFTNKKAEEDSSFKKIEDTNALSEGQKIALPSKEVMDKALGIKTNADTATEQAEAAGNSFEADVIASQLHGAMAGAGTDEDVVNKILDYSSEQVVEILKEYNSKYGSLYKAIEGDFSFSGEDKLVDKLVTSMAEIYNKENPEAAKDKSNKSNVSKLYDATAGKRWGTNEKAVDQVLDSNSATVADTFVEYANSYNSTTAMLDDIRDDYSGGAQDKNIEKIFDALFAEVCA